MTSSGAGHSLGHAGQREHRACTRFSAELAEIVFGEHVSDARVVYEDNLVTRLKAWMETASRSEIFTKCVDIDRALIGELSAPNMLEIARMFEDRIPEVIGSMPKLSGYLSMLQTAHQLAQVFMPANMAMLELALKEEGGR